MISTRFSFLIPTRGNPTGLAKLFRSIRETTDRPDELEVVLAIDEDDAESRAVEEPGLRIRRVISPPKQTMGALNSACYQAASGRFVMVMNDDVVLRTPGWDRLVASALAPFRDDIALVHVNDLLFRERLCTFPMVSRRACEAVGLCPTGYRRYKIDDHIYDIYSMLAYLGHRRILYLPDVVFEHENHVPAQTAPAGHAHTYTSPDGKVYKPKQEIIEQDDRLFLADAEARKAAALRLAGIIEEGRQGRYLGARAAGLHRRLVAIQDPYSYRRPAFVRTLGAEQRPSQATARTTIAVVTSDLRREHTRHCLALIKAHTSNYDLLVLDNAGTKEFSHPRLMNQVLRNAETEFVVLMDDDVFVEPGWLDGLLACVDADTGVVAPMHKDKEGAVSFSGLYLAGDGKGTHEHTLDRPSGPRVMQTYCSAILLIDMAKCGQILMDEAYSKYFFDLTHGFEVWEAGYKTVCTPEVMVTHIGGATMNWGSAESNALLQRDRATFVHEWVESGRLQRLENGIWQRHPHIRRLCEIPRRIDRLGADWESRDLPAFRHALGTLRADCEGLRLLTAHLQRTLRDTVPRMLAQGAADKAACCVADGILAGSCGDEREVLLGVTQDLMARGQHGDAVSLLQQGLTRMPGDVALVKELGLAQFAAEDLGGALRCFLEVVERTPEDIEALASLGTVACRLGRERDGRECFAAALTRIRALGPAGGEYAGLAAKLTTALQSLPGAAAPGVDRPVALGLATPTHQSSNGGSLHAGPTGPGNGHGAQGILVSAIVSTYNAERFLRACLEDLEAQTIRDRLEIVVIDSGSEQDERAIVAEFRQHYSNIVYVRTERENHHAALSRGIRLARGAYVTMANTDDRHRPDAFERMVRVLEARPEVALVYTDCAITDQENATLETGPIIGHFRPPDFDPKLLFRGCFVGPQPMWRKSLHERYGFFDPDFEIAGDYEFWLRLARTETFAHLPEVLGLYLMSPTSNERMNRIRRHQETERARREHWPAAWGELPAWDADYNVMLPREAGMAGIPMGRVPSGDDLAAGFAALEAQAWLEAAQAFIRVLQGDPNRAAARSGLGLALVALGDGIEGLAQLNEGVRLEPSPDLVSNLACGLIHLDRTAEAERLLRGIIEVVPDHAAARENLERLRSGARQATGHQEQTAHGALEALDAASLLEAGARHLAAKRWPEAVETFRKVTTLAPDVLEAQSALGAALLALGRYEEAIPALGAAAEHFHTSQAWNDLGWAALMAGRTEEARAALVKAIETDPANLEPQRNLAALFETLNMPKEAEAAYDLILLSVPQDPEARAGKLRCQGRAASSPQAPAPAEEALVLRHG